MPIPGTIPRYEVRTKVRVGLLDGNRPKSVDYFVTDDPELVSLFGEKPKELLIRLPYAEADKNFRSGAAWWQGSNLTCYTEGLPLDNPVAFRMSDKVDESDTVRSSKRYGAGRTAITCRANRCPHYKDNAANRECKPIGRLDFFLDGGAQNEVLRFETKGEGTIQRLEGFLMGAESIGDLRSRPFKLSVVMKQGRSRYPVVSLSEVPTDG